MGGSPRPACPSCRFAWKLKGIPPVPGFWPLAVRCPNRKCQKQHWFVILRIRLVPGFAYQIVRYVEDPDPSIDLQRTALLLVPELDEDLVELALTIMHTEPEEPAA